MVVPSRKHGPARVVLSSVVAMLVAAALCLRAWDPARAPAPELHTAGEPIPEAMVVPAGLAPAPVRQAIEPALETVLATGSLTVHVVYEDGADAGGVTVNVRRDGGDRRVGVLQAVADAAGCVTFRELAPGALRVDTDRGPTFGKEVAIVGGGAAQLELRIPVALEISGIVVDRDEVPVPGAEVYLAHLAVAGRDIQRVASTDAAGRFALRTGFEHALVGARAEGYAPSKIVMAVGHKGSHVGIRLVLPADGGSVAGTVTDREGRPVAGAIVRVGAGRTESIGGSFTGAPAAPAQVVTDAAGAFRAVGLPAGAHDVQVRAVHLAPWTGTCEVLARAVTHLAVQLDQGCRVHGKVHDEHGGPVPDTLVSVGQEGDVLHYRTSSAADGTFALDGLPAGPLALTASHTQLGSAAAVVHGIPGEVQVCDVRLTRGLELRGVCRTAAGAPAPGVVVHASRGTWSGTARTAADGRFAVSNCPVRGTLTVQTHGGAYEPVKLDGVDPRDGEIELRVRPAIRLAARGRLVGVVLGPDGGAVDNVVVVGRLRGGRGRMGIAFLDTRTGRFAIDGLPPGSYDAVVSAAGYPEAQSATHEVVEQTCDVGTIRLEHGGIVAVRAGVDLADVRLELVTVGGDHVAGIPADELRSPPIRAGAYRLRIRGPGRATAEIAVQVRAQATTTVDVR